MAKTYPIIGSQTRGVDGSSDPLLLGGKQLRHAVNLRFDAGTIKTRPAFEYQPLGIKGQFQGSTVYNPSQGISYRPFGPCGARLVTAAGGGIYLNTSKDAGVECQPMKLENPDALTNCGEVTDRKCTGDVNVFSAENYLIIQNLESNTLWWSGEGPMVASPGMLSEASQTGPEHSGDTFIFTNHKNFLVNGAGLGLYAHGRIHQQGKDAIYVGDLIHSRGPLQTDDILLMEDQSRPVCGSPLSTNSRMGALVALELSPQMGTANGEGLLVGYYEGGVVTYNTGEGPRESKFDVNGVRLQAGWDTKRLVDHKCDLVSAVGRYSVCVLPRDQFFRSGYGVHVLSQVLGVEYINDERVNVISDDVEPVLSSDNPDYLHGSSSGYWIRKNRWFVSTGLRVDSKLSSAPYARGFVSWNKVWAKTEDRTPVTAWEGVWVIDENMGGIHKFTHTGGRVDKGQYGFVSSDVSGNLFFTALVDEGTEDIRGQKSLPVKWAFETGRFNFGSHEVMKVVEEGRFEGILNSKKTRLRVYVRTDKYPVWKLWREFYPADINLSEGEMVRQSFVLGKPSQECEEATWFEFRVEGTGYTEITSFEVEVSPGTSKVATNSWKKIPVFPATDPLSPEL